MPDLAKSLQGRDLGHLRILAEHWRLELTAPDARSAVQSFAEQVLNHQLIQEVLETLAHPARQALDDLLLNEGRLKWAVFSKRHGQIREIGPARRDRDRPDLNPASPAEVLYYHGLLARAFLETDSGPQEFAYIPEDWIEYLPQPRPAGANPAGRPASPAERAVVERAGDSLLDHACTLLAALRLGWSTDHPAILETIPEDLIPALQQLLVAAGLLDSAAVPLPEKTRQFLELERGAALVQLAEVWLNSPDFNELRLIPGVIAEGEWRNDPLHARQVILEFLKTVPTGSWWSLAAFIQAIQKSQPDFQRPAGDYDSWYLRDAASGEFLRGFQNWANVEGRLIAFMLTGPLHWLGFVDLARPTEQAPVSAFRRSAWWDSLEGRSAPPALPAEKEPVAIASQALLRLPRLAPRVARYQLARFAEWQGLHAGMYQYRLTPHSLENASSQGLLISHLISLLRRYARTVPPALQRALERWEARGTEAWTEQVLILRVATPEVIQALRNSPASRFLGDPLGPTAVIIRQNAAPKIMAALAELGYLVGSAIEPK